MPLPKPKKDESQKHFVIRAIANAVMRREYPQRDQRMAVAQSLFSRRKK